MRLSVFLAAVVGVLLLGAAVIVGAVTWRDNLDSNFPSIEVLVATEDIPACTDFEGWASSMRLAEYPATAVPEGALRDTSIVSKQVTIRDVDAGNVIKAQFFGDPSVCPDPAG